MAQLTFLGAAGTVTGSRHVLDIDDTRMLIDCGMFQGPKEFREKNWEPFPIPPESIQRVLLTHAHIDHTGYLPKFCREGFTGRVHCTHATGDLCDILLKDSAHLQEEDAYWANKKGFSRHRPAKPLYTVEDAERALTLFKPLHFGEDFFINDRLRVKFKDSGHMLGSSFIDIRRTENHKGKKILFSGDIGRESRPILRDPVQVFNVDYLVLESTYGERLHEPGSPIEELARVITESVKRGGALVIPAFAIGRTQVLLYVIRDLEEQGKIPELPIYVDSPMAIEATEVFERRIAELDIASRILALNGTKVFRPKNLHICKTRQESKAINEVKGPAIIISSSGMAVGGRVLHHLAKCLPHPENTILLIGYQAHGTRGRTLLEGGDEVKIHGRMIPVKAKVESIMGFSGHADYNEILAWLMGFNRPPEKTFIVHGEPEAAASLAEKIRSTFGWETMIPSLGDSVEIDL
jgi:metallo-beta-lactamase family protein